MHRRVIVDFRIEHNSININWEEVREVINKAGLSTQSVEIIQKAFENSFLRIFIFDENKLIGTGRVISDGLYQAAIYDIAVLPEYQSKGVGRIIMEGLHKDLEGFNVILYAKPTAVNFYKKLGYSKMLTGMARFKDPTRMRTNNFIE
jgi:ribosomal protein S18 acetylase RimI-like enzyme